MSRRWLAREVAKNDKTLIGFWPFQDNMLDYSGLCTHGVSVGGSSASVYAQPWHQFYRHGKKGICIGQYTNDVFVDAGTSINYNFDYTQAFTISCWYYHAGLPSASNGSLVSRLQQSSGINTGYDLKVINDGQYKLVFGLYYQNNYTCNATAMLDGGVDKWYHIVATYDGQNSSNSIRIYVNGKLMPNISTTSNLTFSISNSTGRLQIGNGIGKLSAVSNSSLSLVRIYKRMLSNNDVNKLYVRERYLYLPRKQYKRPAAAKTLPLVIQGPRGFNKTLPLFMWGPRGINGSTTLFIGGKSSINNSATLYIYGKQTITNSATLYIQGVGKSTAGLNMVVYCPTNKFSAPKALPLSIAGNSAGTTSIRKNTTLFISGVAFGHGMNMTLRGSYTDRVTRNMNMFVAGVPMYASKQTTLFLSNTQLGVHASVPLLISGSGDPNTLPNSVLYGKSLNLFIKRWPSNVMPLFLACASPVANSVPMYTKGASIKTASVPLSIPKITGAYNQSVPLYVSGY